MRFKFLLINLLVLSLSCAFAQKSTITTITGVVTDLNTREPLVGVTVYMCDDPSVGTVTDFDGNYSITLDLKKPEKLCFSYVGYDTNTSGNQRCTNRTQNLIICLLFRLVPQK